MGATAVWSGRLGATTGSGGSGTDFSWTTIPDIDPLDQIIYISAIGNDGYNGLFPVWQGGLDGPKRTLGQAKFALRDGHGDRLYFRCGDTFGATQSPPDSEPNMNAWRGSGVSNGRPIVISSYGSGARPNIDFGASGYFFQPDWGGQSVRANFIWFIGLEIYSSTYNGTVFQGAFRYNWQNHDLKIEDCYVHDCTLGIETNGATYGRVANVSVRGNTWSNMHYDVLVQNPGCHGAYNDDVDGLTYENNLWLDCGWPRLNNTYATTFKHAIYVHAGGTGIDGGGCTAVTVKDNLVVGGDGITCRPGGNVTGNVCVQSLSGVQVGMGDAAQVGGITVTFEDNVAIELLGFNTGFAGSGAIGYAIGNVSGVSSFRNNICANATTGSSPLQPRGFWFRTPDNLGPSGLVVGAALAFQNNIFYRAGEFWGQERPPASYTGITTMTGNDFQLTASPSSNDTFYMNSAGQMLMFLWVGNNYYSTAPNPQWFQVTGTTYTFAQWAVLTADGTATNTDNSGVYPDPTRNLGDWYQSIGGTNSTDDAVTYLKTRSRASNWVNVRDIAAYLRAGFGR